MFNEWLEKKIQSLDMSKDAFAIKVGISTSTLYRILGGHLPERRTLKKMSTVVGVSTDKLVQMTCKE